MFHYKKEIVVSHPQLANNFPIGLCVELADLWGKNDCKIGHFGYNFYFRTPYGVKAKSYVSDKRMEKAIEKVLKNKGFKIVEWR
jgi:hypothetical protein